MPDTKRPAWLQRLRKRYATPATVLVAVFAAAGLTAPAASGAATAHPNYVAVGDSFAAGPLIPHQTGGSCLRSSSNYPARLAATLKVATFTDVTCSGAATTSLASQYPALNANTDLVTLTIGANDAGLFQAVLNCVNILPQPIGTPCKARYTAGGTDQLAAAVDAAAPAIGAAINQIHLRAPNAKVIVTTYADYIRPGGCWNPVITPILSVDGDYLQNVIDRLGTRISEQAAAHHATFVDFRGPGVGHDVCASEPDRWVEPLLPGSPAAPIHPNAQGMTAFAGIIASKLD
ncbi:SGNH/GDSL hydrolase family protein [Amycolatopsis sp. NBC_00345]|uniref:SGNH/GDSL hydrolase family protein n=1 Tax=Amycolatopsis sp. NBC_00345 TaxID=2975955 RepID=UPI002E2599C5